MLSTEKQGGSMSGDQGWEGRTRLLKGATRSGLPEPEVHDRQRLEPAGQGLVLREEARTGAWREGGGET